VALDEKGLKEVLSRQQQQQPQQQQQQQQMSECRCPVVTFFVLEKIMQLFLSNCRAFSIQSYRWVNKLESL